MLILVGGRRSHEPPAAGSNRADCVSASSLVARPGSRRMRARRWRGEGRLEAGSQSAREAPWGCRDRRRRRREKDEEASWEGSERGGKRAGVENRKEGTTEETVGAAGSLYPGQAARRRHPRSGGAKPEEAAHRQRFYKPSYDHVTSVAGTRTTNKSYGL
jgi:hypothetical protein